METPELYNAHDRTQCTVMPGFPHMNVMLQRIYQTIYFLSDTGD
jgi:hypothetical protein